MSQTVMNEFFQHLSDDDRSNHEEASDTGAAPKQQQPRQEEYDIWVRDGALPLEYIDNDVWKKFKLLKRMEGKKNILLMAILKEPYEKIVGMDDAKEIWNGLDKEYGSDSNKLLSLLEATWNRNLLHGNRTMMTWTLIEMNINWQVSNDCLFEIKKFYKKQGRRVRVDGKKHLLVLTKKLILHCHNTGHFARECTAKETHDGKKKRDSFYQHQEAGKQEKNQMGLLTMDDGRNWNASDGKETQGKVTLSQRRYCFVLWPNINSVRTNINTGRTNINFVRPRVNTVNTNVNTVRSRQPVPTRTSNSFSPKRPQGFVVKTSAGYNWRLTRPNSNCNGGPTFIRTVITKGPQGRPKPERPRALEGNKDTLEDFFIGNSMGDLLPLEVAKATYLKEEILTEPPINENKDSSTDIQKIIPKILAFRRADEPVNTGRLDPDDSPMLELEIFHKSGRLIDEEVYVSQPPSFVDPDHPKKVYKVVKALYGLHQAPRAWTRGDSCGSSVTPKTSHLNAVKRIFKYLKGKPHLGLWYPRESPFDLEAFSDSDYGGSNLDRKSTTGGCQFLGHRLISWQCKKQTIVATSTTKAEYVAAANCCGQVLWVQNQLLDYGFNFMNTKIYIDNESTICIVKNPVYHSKTKHIEKHHHFIRDCYEKKLISVEKIHTDLNVADLLTKPFDGPRFNYLVVNIGFAEIVDFLRGSNLRYALTTNPSIYDSLVKQFWQTATVNTLADGTLEL
ncbi:putative ribonuclease H-like domain-containing protein, partial [Tanacetum coccineum]